MSLEFLIIVSLWLPTRTSSRVRITPDDFQEIKRKLEKKTNKRTGVTVFT